MDKVNTVLPGNPRYQPKDLVPFFGYDNLYSFYVQVEMATLETLHDRKIIPDHEYVVITTEVNQELKEIKTSFVDQIERSETKHDIRALVRAIQAVIREKITRWVHVPLTSYDVIDTGRALMFYKAYAESLRPALIKLIGLLADKVEETAAIKQIGRTHGQHALPITVGFWLATILYRLMYNLQEMEDNVDRLVGKISGAVGAYNAQIGLQIGSEENSFEVDVLSKLGLKPSPISTQIVPPEPLAYFFHSVIMTSATLAQFGRDARHLMRTEIAEIQEAFEKDQVGSSTMAHKRNPINFENTEGFWIKNKNEYGKVLDTLISEHQRDLVGSSVARDFPIMMINLQHQINTFLRKGKSGKEFISAIVVNKENCQKNLSQSAGFVIAEPMYIALQMAGFQGDAHHLVNHVLMPKAKEKGLVVALVDECEKDENLDMVVKSIPNAVFELLETPEDYTGLATRKALQIAADAKVLVVNN